MKIHFRKIEYYCYYNNLLLLLTYHDISIRKLYTVLLKFINTIFFLT